MTMSPTEARSATVSISELVGCSGLEVVAGLADGSVARPLPFTLLPPEEGKANLLATPEPRFCNDSGEMRVIGHVVSRGRTVITLEGRIEDAHGSLFVHGASTCLIVSRKP